MKSSTKFISGHCDVLSGALMINDEKVSEKIKLIQNTGGAVVSPFDAWLLLRSVKNISLRAQKQFDNAKYIADWLDNNPKATKVVYPGLPSHSQFEIASQQQFSPDNKPVYGSMISFEVDSSIDLDKFANGPYLVEIKNPELDKLEKLYNKLEKLKEPKYHEN